MVAVTWSSMNSFKAQVSGKVRSTCFFYLHRSLSIPLDLHQEIGLKTQKKPFQVANAFEILSMLRGSPTGADERKNEVLAVLRIPVTLDHIIHSYSKDGATSESAFNDDLK